MDTSPATTLASTPPATVSDFSDLFALAQHNKQQFGREVSSEVYRVRDNQLLAITQMHDDYHDIEFALLVDDKWNIVAVAPKMTRIPYPVCKGAVEAYSRMVGLNIFQRGILRKIKDAVGRTSGCTHLFELVENTLRTLFAASYSLSGIELIDHLALEEVRQINLHSPLLADTCHSFATDSRNDDIFTVALEKLGRFGIGMQDLTPIKRTEESTKG